MTSSAGSLLGLVLTILATGKSPPKEEGKQWHQTRVLACGSKVKRIRDKERQSLCPEWQRCHDHNLVNTDGVEPACSDTGYNGTSSSIWEIGFSGQGDASSISCQAGKKARRSFMNHAQPMPNTMFHGRDFNLRQVPLNFSSATNASCFSGILRMHVESPSLSNLFT